MDTQNPTLDLAVVRQQLTELAHAQVTLEQVEANLTPIYNAAIEAGDENTQALLTQAWNSAVEIAGHASQAMALAEGVTSAAEVLRQQRDTIAAQHTQLHDAIESMDCEHPLVNRVFEIAEENLWEYITMVQSEGDGIHSDEPGEDIAGGYPDMDMDAANEFAYILFGKVYGASLSEDLKDELTIFVNDFGTRAAEYLEKQREIAREEYEARRAAQQKVQAAS